MTSTCVFVGEDLITKAIHVLEKITNQKALKVHNSIYKISF